MKKWPVPAALLFVAQALSAVVITGTCLGETTGMIRNVRWLPLTQIENEALAALASPAGKLHDLPLRFTPYNILRPRIPARIEIFSDRKVYLADDPVGQFLIYFAGQDISAPNTKLVVNLQQLVSSRRPTDPSGPTFLESRLVLSREFSPVQTPKVAFLLDTGSLAPGTYLVTAKLLGKSNVTIPDLTFQKSADKHRAVPFPAEGVPLLVHSQDCMPNAEWPITTGIPLPRAASDTTDRFYLTEDGKPVAAQFTTRATWYPDGTQVKWMGLDFIARYQDGKPREYRLKLLPEKNRYEAMGTPLKVTESPDAFTVDTGKIRFTVNRKNFTGVNNVWLLNADGTTGAQVVKGDAGPYLVNAAGTRFDAANDKAVKVELLAKGPVRATISASGWYVSASGEKLCQFRTQINAFAGQPAIDVLQRTIITYDTDTEKLADLGFAVKTPGAEQYAFGVDGAAKTGSLPDNTVWLHQYRWNQCRVMGADGTAAEAKKSDGWASASGKSGGMAVLLRNIWQLYPKELEIGRDAVTLHFWPKHGFDTFTEQEQLVMKNLYKFFYCHQGQFLNLKFPESYFKRAYAYGGARGMIEQQDVNARSALGQGLAISNNFCLVFGKPVSADAAAKQAALYQKNPHAIAEPAWNAKTEVEGRFAPEDRKHFDNVEKVLNEGYRGNTTTPAILEEYGMWIWPDTHNNWNPVSKLPEWHRLWNLSHYQNVWESWLQYLRSGDQWEIDWARDNTAHYMDVGTVNYDDPSHPILGHLKGATYHDKGLLPWGMPRYGEECGDDYCEVGGHFINPDAFVIEWLVMGDPRGFELMNAWGKSFDRAALPPERSREENNTIGEMLSYYVTTWDPQAMVYIKDLADETFSRPAHEIPAAYGHCFFGKQWARRYWELTRDDRIKLWVTQAWDDGMKNADFYQLAALLYEWTGDKKYLQQSAPSLALWWQLYYYNPKDPLDGFGPRLGDLGTSCLEQKAPYFLQACLDAGIESIPTDESRMSAIGKTTQIKKATPFGLGFARAYLHPAGANPVVTLTFTAATVPGNAASSMYVRVEDAKGAVLLETTVLAGSLRPSDKVTIDMHKNPAPWKLYRAASISPSLPLPTLTWNGSADSLMASAAPIP